jgi:hypothetical protein
VGTTHVVIDSGDVKNKVDLEYPLPCETSDLLEIYIKRFRPILAKSPSYWVFPGEGPSLRDPLIGKARHRHEDWSHFLLPF